MWELDHKESWAPENWCFQIVVLKKTLERPLNFMEIKLVNPKGNQPWILIGRATAEAEAPILWTPDAKNWLIGKGPDAGKDWRQKEQGTTEDEMVGWYHRLNIHEFEQDSGVGDGQGCLVCCRPWGHKELDMTEWLNWIERSPIVPQCHNFFSAVCCSSKIWRNGNPSDCRSSQETPTNWMQ